MNKILVVEDEANTAELLRRYFEIVGYSVVNALNGTDAVKAAEKEQPEVIILDINLPDMDGYEVCRQLRINPITDRIPIVFLTQRDDRLDRLEGLKLGADDYIGKPFDVEELRLRVHNIIANSGGTPLVDARTSLPNADMMRERLPELIDKPGTTFFKLSIEHYEAFRDKHGAVAANQVLRTTAKMISDTLHEVGGDTTFIGHPDDYHFVVGVDADKLDTAQQALSSRFDDHVKRHYDEDENIDMALALTSLTPDELKALVG